MSVPGWEAACAQHTGVKDCVLQGKATQRLGHWEASVLCGSVRWSEAFFTKLQDIGCILGGCIFQKSHFPIRGGIPVSTNANHWGL